MGDSWPERVIKLGLEWRIAADEGIRALEIACAFDPIFTPIPAPSDLEIPRLIQERMGALAQPPEPAGVSLMVDYLVHSSQIIDLRSAELTIAKDVLETWTGEAADSFGEYLTRMHGAASNLKGIFDGLRQITEAYGAVVKALDTDFSELVDKYSSAIHEARIDQLEVGLAVVAAIPSIVAAGGLGGVVAGALAGGASVAQSIIGASNELEVWRSFALALRYLRETFEVEIKRIEDGYRYFVEELVLNPQRLPAVNPDAPKLITQKAFDPGDFSLPDSPQFERGKMRVDTSDLVPDPKKKDLDRKLDPERAGR